MRIPQLKVAYALCGDSEITPFVWGHAGLGKSDSVRQFCYAEDRGFIDMRCSQIEASDLRGLPDQGDDGRTHFLPPADMPIGDLPTEVITEALAEAAGLKVPKPDPENRMTALQVLDYQVMEEKKGKRREYEIARAKYNPRFTEGVLFLDELNRAQDDVMQAVFQLVLDRACGQYVLPPGWFIVAAGNYSEGEDYQTNSFSDRALLDRFCHVQLDGGETTVDDWVGWIAAKHGGAGANVLEFTSTDLKHLEGDPKGELGFKVEPSRRAWDKVIQVEKAAAAGDYPQEVVREVVAGLVGRELALSYQRYSCPVKPKELIDKGVKPFHAKIGTLARGQKQGLMWGMISYIKARVSEEKYATVALDFAECMLDHGVDGDIVVAFCRALVQGDGDTGAEHEKARAAMISNPRLAKLMSQFSARKGGKKRFIDYLNERPKLQKLLSKTAWGTR
jgi:hypothetical protein